MSTITKEQAQKIIEAADEVITSLAGTNDDVHPESDSMLRLWDDLNDRYAPPEVVRELARIALESLEAEPVSDVVAWSHQNEERTCDVRLRRHDISPGPLYTAPPAQEFYKIGDATMRHIFTPTGITDVSDMQAVFDQIETVLAGMWQPAPVSVPDAATAFRACMEEFPESVHDIVKECAAIAESACRAAMLQGAEPVTTAYKLPDGWVACSERMPDIGTEIFYFCQDDGLRDCGIVSSSNFSGKGDAELYVHAEGYDLRFGVDISHWMPLPASPQQK
ncbi:TPA: DUF551 domain-containing protein [Enterobacter hormaechei]|nr:DUF551 domain-containing protein [Enterobacter hormaechei]